MSKFITKDELGLILSKLRNGVSLNTQSIQDINDFLTVTSVSLRGNSIAYKFGKIVRLKLDISSLNLSSGQWNDLFTLPEGYRPVINFDFVGVNNSASATSNIATDMRITAEGVVRMWGFSGQTSINLTGNVTYMTN